MRLYSRFGASQVINEDHGVFDVDPDSGAVEVPPALGAVLHNQHVNGLRAWENDAERAGRIAAEELARRKDPATLLAAVEALAAKVPDPTLDPAPAPAAVAKSEAGIESLSVKQLREHAAANGITVGKARSRADLIAVIDAHEHAEDAPVLG